MKQIFFRGLTAGLLATLAAIIYFNIYQNALATHFNKMVNTYAIAGASILGCMLMAVGYALLYQFNKSKLSGFLNLLITILSFLSIISPIAMSLPINIESPELFPGLVIPMHFFPALSFFCISPFFSETTSFITRKNIDKNTNDGQ